MQLRLSSGIISAENPCFPRWPRPPPTGFKASEAQPGGHLAGSRGQYDYGAAAQPASLPGLYPEDPGPYLHPELHGPLV